MCEREREEREGDQLIERGKEWKREGRLRKIERRRRTRKIKKGSEEAVHI